MSTAQPTVVPSTAPGIDGWRQRLRDRAQLAGLGFGGSASLASQHSAVRHLAFLPAEALELDLDDPAQRQFGAYELRAKLGQGGMGVVYRAYQPALDREVAIKLLAAGPWASAEFIARFQREAQHAARLNHPNIVPIHEIGVHEELNFFSMALVRGQTLARRIADQGPLPPRNAAALLLTVAEALDYAHRLDVLHLDLKPGNVLLDERGVPMVADFGLARRLDQSLAADSNEVSGTPSYMAPEQATLKSHKLSPATDVYGLGAILYEMLAGRPPFLGATPQETLKHVVGDEPESLRRTAPGTPADLEAICLKCLAKHPKDRYSSARELADDLRRFIENRPVSVRPLTAMQRAARWAARQPRLAAAIGVAVLALIVGAGVATWQWQRAESGAAQARAALWSDRLDGARRALGERGAFEALPALFANLAEQEAVGAQDDAVRSRVRIGAVLAAAPTLVDSIPGSEGISAVALAPDGSWSASAGEGSVQIRETGNGSLRCRFAFGTESTSGVSDGVIGQLRPVDDGRGLLVLPMLSSVPPWPDWEGILLDTRDCAQRHPPKDRFGNAPHMTWSPDAAYAIVRSGPNADDGELVRVRDWQRLARAGAPPFGGNEWLLAPGLAHVALASDTWRQLEVLDPATLAPRHRYVHGDSETLRASAWTRDGSRLALAYAGGDVVLLDPATGTTTTLTPPFDAQPHALEFSADDAWLAATATDGSVRVWDAASGKSVGPPVRTQRGWPLAHPDAKRRTVLVRLADSVQLWSMSGRSADPVLLWRLREESYRLPLPAAAWNPGISLLATGSKRGELRLWRAPGSGIVPASGPLLSLNEADPAFDGRHVVDVDGTNVRVLDLDRGGTAGPAIAHPQAVSFALLAIDPPRLVTSAGNRLYVHDWRSGQLAFPPLELENSPGVVALAPGTQRILVMQSERDGERNVTRLESYALDTGRQLGRIVLDGLLAHIGFSNDGRRVLAPQAGSIRVLDVDTLAEVFPALRFGPDALAMMREHYAASGPLGTQPGGERVARAFATQHAADGPLWVIVNGNQTDAPGGGITHELILVDGRSGRSERRWQIDSEVGSAHALPGDRVALLLQGRHELRIVARDGEVQSASLPDADAYAGIQISGDAGRLAIALKRGVAVFDVGTGQWLSPTLASTLAFGDAVSGLSLDHTGGQLLVRSMRRALARYRLPVENRPVAELQRTISLLRGDELRPGIANPQVVDDAERARMRATDPGPPTDAPAPARASEAAATPSADPDPRFVALDAACTRWPRDPGGNFGFLMERVLPPGRHRLLGIDFDVRCAVVVPTESDGLRSRPIPLRMPQAAAFELLITGDTLYPDRADVAYAVVEFAYVDGATERIPILYRRQVWEHWQPTLHAAEARVAYRAIAGRDAISGHVYPPTLFAVRVTNPHPERALAALVLEAVDRPWSGPVLLAVTQLLPEASR